MARAAQSQVDALREEADRTPLAPRSSSLTAASNVVSSVFGLFGGGTSAKTGAAGVDGAERPDAELADGHDGAGSSSGDDLRRHRQAIVLLLMRSIAQVWNFGLQILLFPALICLHSNRTEYLKLSASLHVSMFQRNPVRYSWMR